MENYPSSFPLSVSLPASTCSRMPSNTGSSYINGFTDYFQSSKDIWSMELTREMEVSVGLSNESTHKDNKNSGVVGSDDIDKKSLSGREKGVKKVKKPRYAFQTRSRVDILDDGYKWRKYGQKAVKNNKFPRSYYRCTHQGCNVKKQVQRLTGDEGIVVTTYEGMHSHPINKSNDNFEHILSQMQIYTSL